MMDVKCVFIGSLCFMIDKLGVVRICLYIIGVVDVVFVIYYYNVIFLLKGGLYWVDWYIGGVIVMVV